MRNGCGCGGISVWIQSSLRYNPIIADYDRATDLKEKKTKQNKTKTKSVSCVSTTRISSRKALWSGQIISSSSSEQLDLTQEG